MRIALLPYRWARFTRTPGGKKVFKGDTRGYLIRKKGRRERVARKLTGE